jgi:internalin A
MHSTHQFFLSQRSLYLLVLNGRQGREDADAEYWLNLIESFGGDSPVLVVLNKISASPFDVNRRGLLSKFPTLIKGFIRTDCQDRTGIDELKEAIRHETDRLEHLRDAFPASWFAIKERLAGMAENYLTFDAYQKICAEHGELDSQAQDSLAFSLHHLGVALNYKDDPRLRDMHVLNPHWVTNGIYTLINDKRIKEHKGELRLSDIAGILDRQTYPPARHSFLLELMRKFELAFRFPEEESRYLIPDLLDKQEPEEAAAFQPEACLNFQYHYPIIPEGLLPRFIVRSRVLSTGQPRWRTGVILEFDGNRALVKADLQERKVLVSVAGPAASRQRLLAVIRADFEHLHRSYTFTPQEMVPLTDFPEVAVSYQKLCEFEKGGITTFPEVVGGQVVQLNVTKLLNGVDLEGSCRVTPTAEARPQALRLFFSYSHKDEGLRDELETHLKLLQRLGKLETWSDRRITAGQEWAGQIDDNLERADLILLLVSADFVASDYCYEKEMGRALERHQAGATRVVPVIIRDVQWQKAPFGELQALPTDGRAVATWGSTKFDRDSAWRNVADGIEAVIAELEMQARRKT